MTSDGIHTFLHFANNGLLGALNKRESEGDVHLRTSAPNHQAQFNDLGVVRVCSRRSSQRSGSYIAFLGIGLIWRTFFHSSYEPHTPMKYTELFASRWFRFLEIGQILIRKVALALCMMQTAFFNAFARHTFNSTVHSIYLNILSNVHHLASVNKPALF